MEMISAEVALCKEHPPITGGFPSEKGQQDGTSMLAQTSCWANSYMACDFIHISIPTLCHCNENLFL